MSVLNNGKIEGKLVYLRPLTLDDTENVIKWRNSENVKPYFIYQKPFTKEGHLEWVRTMLDTKKGYQFVICENNTDKPLGCTYIRDFEEEHNKIEYGMFIGEKTQVGKGVGTEVVELTARYVFEELNIHKMFCRIFADNMPSIKSCEKGGFVQEAYLKDEVRVNGKYRDMVLLAMLNPNQTN